MRELSADTAARDYLNTLSHDNVAILVRLAALRWFDSDLITGLFGNQASEVLGLLNLPPIRRLSSGTKKHYAVQPVYRELLCRQPDPAARQALQQMWASAAALLLKRTERGGSRSFTASLEALRYLVAADPEAAGHTLAETAYDALSAGRTEPVFRAIRIVLDDEDLREGSGDLDTRLDTYAAKRCRWLAWLIHTITTHVATSVDDEFSPDTEPVAIDLALARLAPATTKAEAWLFEVAEEVAERTASGNQVVEPVSPTGRTAADQSADGNVAAEMSEWQLGAADAPIYLTPTNHSASEPYGDTDRLATAIPRTLNHIHSHAGADKNIGPIGAENKDVGERLLSDRSLNRDELSRSKPSRTRGSRHNRPNRIRPSTPAPTNAAGRPRRSPALLLGVIVATTIVTVAPLAFTGQFSGDAPMTHAPTTSAGTPASTPQPCLGRPTMISESTDGAVKLQVCEPPASGHSYWLMLRYQQGNDPQPDYYPRTNLGAPAQQIRTVSLVLPSAIQSTRGAGTAPATCDKCIPDSIVAFIVSVDATKSALLESGRERDAATTGIEWLVVSQELVLRYGE